MKKLICKLTVVLTLTTLVSCTDWLTIQPVTESSSDQLVQTESGLKLILAGTYTRMMATSTYSGPYSPTGIATIERMTGFWPAGITENYMAEGNFDANDELHYYNNTLFMSYYNIIANINPAINGMVEHKANINPRSYAIIRGEALAIRACAHLDLLRIYGPVPTAVGPNEKYLPYVSTYSHNAYTYHTFDEYMTLLLADLDEAEQLLKEYDPVLTTHFLDSETEEDNWPNFNRKAAFNYYGVLGLQARARLWRGTEADKAEALRYARMIKDAVEPNGDKKFRLTVESDFNSETSAWSNDKLCFSEQICGVKSKDYAYNTYQNMWKPDMISLYNPQLNTVYTTNDYYYSNDARWAKYNSSYTSAGSFRGYYINKYHCFYESSNSPMNFPVVRLSEIYFMIMELSTLEEANELYEEYCISRGFVNQWYPFVPMTEETRKDLILIEFLREYMAEGQNFYMYKRNGVKNKWFVTTEMTNDLYRVPIPEGEMKNAN